ncbi:acyltransferase [Nocardia sp. NPDC088792]|uniref:acyltransferase n=1 Tax=Nocardia sp. NPDC088792 TaxID=3364332 RepID=UPI003815C78A
MTGDTLRETETPRRTARPHLYQVDLFRVLTFACVIAVHVIDQANNPGSVSAHGVLTLLHFTRNAFFALTGFVLVYQFAGDRFRAGSFWRRRFMLVGIPYVVWSVVYWGYSIYLHENYGTIGWLLSRLGLDLVWGTAYYHLYFLLVTMQVYLLFPLLRKLLQATAGRHRWVLAVSAVIHVVVLWYLHNPPFSTGIPGQIWTHLPASFLPYQFFTLIGAITAWHIEAVHAFLRKYGGVVVAAVVVTGVAAEWYYLHLVHTGIPPWTASDVFLPALTVWFLAVCAGLYLLGTRWAIHRQENHVLARVIRYGSDRSFGIFLVHPLFIEILVPQLPASWPQPWKTILLYLAVVALALATTEVLRRIPGSLWLTGRPMLRTDPSILIPRRFRSPAPSDGASKEVVCSPTP